MTDFAPLTPKQTGLNQNTLQALQQVFAEFEEIDKVVLYGSRAKGTYKAGSDIDLTVVLQSDVPATLSLLFAIQEAVEDLDLIYNIDLSLMADIQNPDLIEHINRVGQQLYSAKSNEQIPAVSTQ